MQYFRLLTTHESTDIILLGDPPSATTLSFWRFLQCEASLELFVLTDILLRGVTHTHNNNNNKQTNKQKQKTETNKTNKQTNKKPKNKKTKGGGGMYGKEKEVEKESRKRGKWRWGGGGSLVFDFTVQSVA